MIWIIGNKGMLGTELSHVFENNKIDFFGTDREVDITDRKALINFAGARSIDFIVNCAAYTAVDKAEDDEVSCRLLNVEGAANIALAAKSLNARLIHISTDYVFDGKGKMPYKEGDETCPTGVYGLSKRDGEISVLKENPDSYIIRTAWLYGKYGKNFVHTMLRLMNERDKIKVVNDQYGSPTWAFDFANVILILIKTLNKGQTVPFGIYHYTNEGNITWFDFAKEIYKQGRESGHLKKECKIKPCTSAEYQTRASRPVYSVLDKTKIKKSLNIKIPDWDTSLNNFILNGK